MASSKRRADSDASENGDELSVDETSNESRSNKRQKLAENGTVGTVENGAHHDAVQEDMQDFNSDTEEITADESQHILNELQANKTNHAADYGIIEEVLCINFMCHAKLRIKLGPLINFIIGHNGSGKSAVLTALTLCLGAKATSTNRGANLKAFIKQGETNAMLSVKIKNQGELAYQPDVYGDSIIVERHFSISGTTGFKVKSANERLVTTKRADLEDMLDYLALQLDNPMNVLTQDLARQFLSNSTPRDKYKFFMRGTQLEQLDRDYRIMEETVNGTESTLLSRKDDIAVLEKRVAEVEQRKKIIDEAATIRATILRLQHMHVWAQVEEKERSLADATALVQSIDREIADAEAKAQTTSEEYDQQNQIHETASASRTKLEESHASFASKHGELKEKFDGYAAELKNNMAVRRRIKEDLQQAKSDIERHQRSIDNEEARIEAENGPAQAQRLADLEQAKRDREARQAEYEALDIIPLEHAQNAAKDKAQALRPQLAPKREALKKAEGMLANLSNRDREALSAYHPKMSLLLRAIQNETRFKAKPVGPMGMSMRLKKPEWSSILETVIGGALDGFIVTNYEDRKLLADVQSRVGCETAIFLGRPQAIDTTGKEPDPSVDTILRVLEIDSDLVRNQIIINQTAEQTVLMRDSQTGFNFIENEHHRNQNVKVLIAMHDTKRGWGIRYMRGSGAGPVRAHQRQARIQTDREAQIREQRAIVEQLKGEYHQAERRVREVDEELKEANQAVARFTRDQKKCRENVQRAEAVIEDLTSQIEADKIDAGQLETYQEQLKDAKEAEAQHSATYEDAIIEKDRINELQIQIKRDLNSATEEKTESELKIKKTELRITKTAENRHKALVEKNKAIEDIEKAKSRREQAEVARDSEQKIVDEYTSKAEEYHERVAIDAGMTVDKIDRRLARIQQDHANMQDRAGGSREEVIKAWYAAKTKYKEASDEYRSSKKLSDCLKAAMATRKVRWKAFRKYITARAMFTFTYLLSERAFRGRILVDHKNMAMDISVEPDMARNSDRGRQTKTLSGGEKSFSTICLLLSIWEAMGSPIRCLDEFDVFMDNVNRDISMKMMIAAANRAIQRQFILITPQAMGNIHTDSNVKIHRMSDPERGQTALPFGS